MRALVRVGDPKALTLDNNHPEPPTSSENSPDVYIIRTKATALCRDELTWPEPLVPEVPVPGYDVTGEVIAVPTALHPDGAYRFKPGDQVYAYTMASGKGNARELTVALEKEMALKPKNLSWEEAATVPLSALSGWQALFVHAKLRPDFTETSENKRKRVLVTAASGGVGIWGVQLAHLAGAKVVATCGTSNVDFVKSLGADTVLDYRTTNLLDWIDEDRDNRDFDVVFDCIGGQTLTDAFKCTRRNGIVVSVAEPLESRKSAAGEIAEGVQGVYFIVSESSGQLSQLTELIEQGKCRTVVDSVYALEDYEAAFKRVEGGHAKGKVVLKV